MNGHTLFDIAGKKAIVTGGTRGLGRGMAEALLEAGCEVAIIGSSSNVFRTRDDFTERGYACHAFQADLRHRNAVLESFDACLESLNGGLDILCTAAGIQRRHPPEDFPLDDWDDVISLNLTAVFIQCQKAGRIMIKKGYGKIINVTSVVYHFGSQQAPAYTASKGAVAQLTRALSNDWFGKGINVNAIAPGYMHTAMCDALVNDPVRGPHITDRIPAGRWGTPDDMKGATIFLASKASDFLGGAIIPVDGGYLAR